MLANVEIVKNLTKLKIDNKSVDLVLSIEVNRNKYDYNIIASNLKNFLTPTKFWIIADIFELKTFKYFKNLLKKNKIQLEKKNSLYHIFFVFAHY